MKKLNKILNTFTKTVNDLKVLEDNNYAEAYKKREKAAKITSEADAAVSEAQTAAKVRENIEKLLGGSEDV